MFRFLKTPVQQIEQFSFSIETRSAFQSKRVPFENLSVFKGNLFVFKGNLFVSKGNLFVFKGNLFVFNGNLNQLAQLAKRVINLVSVTAITRLLTWLRNQFNGF